MTLNNCLSHLTPRKKRMWHLEQFLESIAISIIRFHGFTVTLRYDVFRQYVDDSCVQRDTRADLSLSDRVFPDTRRNSLLRTKLRRKYRNKICAIRYMRIQQCQSYFTESAPRDW